MLLSWPTVEEEMLTIQLKLSVLLDISVFESCFCLFSAATVLAHVLMTDVWTIIIIIVRKCLFHGFSMKFCAIAGVPFCGVSLNFETMEQLVKHDGLYDS